MARPKVKKGFPGGSVVKNLPADAGAFIQPTGPSLSSNGQIQAVVNYGREVKQSRAALGQGPVSTSKDTHNNIFELFCRY